jgi:hypothetical protein
MSEQNVYEVAAGITIWRSDTLGGSVTTQMGGIKKITGLPGAKVDTFETTREDQVAGETPDWWKQFGAGFIEGKELTFGLGHDEAEVDSAWGIIREKLNFEFRFPGGSVYPFVAIVTGVEEVDDGQEIITNVTLKPSGAVGRTAAP